MFCMAIAIRFLLTHVAPYALVWASSSNTVVKLLMLFVQLGVISSFYDLREHVVENCRVQYRAMRKGYVRFSIVYSNIIWLAGMYSCLSLLWSLPLFFNIYVIIELLLLSAWIWVWCGIAVPMSAARYWKGWFTRKIFDTNPYKLK